VTAQVRNDAAIDIVSLRIKVEKMVKFSDICGTAVSKRTVTSGEKNTPAAMFVGIFTKDMEKFMDALLRCGWSIT
jgi:hypothetical protein